MDRNGPGGALLGHIYWIGGGSGAGKTTTARILGARHGFAVYGTDEAMADHASRLSQEDSPFLQQFLAMDMDDRWLNRTPHEMLETFHWFRGEAFELILDDLLGRSNDQPVIVEGFRLLPARVKEVLDDPARAVWLLPTPEFRRAAFESRRPSGPPWSFLDRTSDERRSLANLLERDRMFTERLREETRALGLRAFDIDVGTTRAEVVELVASALEL